MTGKHNKEATQRSSTHLRTLSWILDSAGIGQKLRELIRQAIGDRQAGPIFLSPAGKGWSVPNLSRTYSRLWDLAGLSRDLVRYLARHECGTKICREKGIEYARRLLGQANISTTQRYMHLDDRELAEAQDLVE